VEVLMLEVLKTWTLVPFFFVCASVVTVVLTVCERRVDRPHTVPRPYVYTGGEPPPAFLLVDRQVWAPIDGLAGAVGEYEVPDGHFWAGSVVRLDDRAGWRLSVDRRDAYFVECRVDPKVKDGWYTAECAQIVGGRQTDTLPYRLFLHRVHGDGGWLRVQLGELFVVEGRRDRWASR
jgi:hypothetical protein